MTNAATDPTTIPAMAPPESPLLPLLADEELPVLEDPYDGGMVTMSLAALDEWDACDRLKVPDS
jgi:hypothetical protein